MGIWSEHFHPRVLLRWVVLGWIIGLLLAVAGIVLIFDQYLTANVCFVLVALFLVAKIIFVAVSHRDKLISALIFAILLCSLVGVSITATVIGVDKYRDSKHEPKIDSENAKSHSAPASSSTPTQAATMAPLARSAPTQGNQQQQDGTSDRPITAGEIKAANVLAIRLLNEYASKHCPIKAEETVAWINRQLRSQKAHFQISGVPPDNRICKPIAGVGFGNVKGLDLEGLTIVNPAGPGIVVNGSPGASVDRNTLVYGDHTQIQVPPPTSPPTPPPTQPPPQ